MQLNTRALKYLCICKILLSCIFITELDAAEKATQPQTKNETEKSKARLKLDESLKLDEFSETQGKTLNETLDEYKRGIKNSPDLVGATDRLFLVKKKKYELLKDLEVLKLKAESIL